MLALKPDVTKRISNWNFYVSSSGVSPDVILKPLSLRHIAGFNVIAPDIDFWFSFKLYSRHSSQQFVEFI